MAGKLDSFFDPSRLRGRWSNAQAPEPVQDAEPARAREQHEFRAFAARLRRAMGPRHEVVENLLQDIDEQLDLLAPPAEGETADPAAQAEARSQVTRHLDTLEDLLETLQLGT